MNRLLDLIDNMVPPTAARAVTRALRSECRLPPTLDVPGECLATMETMEIQLADDAYVLCRVASRRAVVDIDELRLNPGKQKALLAFVSEAHAAMSAFINNSFKDMSEVKVGRAALYPSVDGYLFSVFMSTIAVFKPDNQKYAAPAVRPTPTCYWLPTGCIPMECALKGDA